MINIKMSYNDTICHIDKTIKHNLNVYNRARLFLSFNYMSLLLNGTHPTGEASGA